MDTGEGRLVHGNLDELLQQRGDVQARMREANMPVPPMPTWQVGEEVEIKGSRLRVVSLGSKFITFKVLPWQT